MRLFKSALVTIGIICLFNGDKGLAAERDRVVFAGDTIYPEGVSWSASQRRFFVGSVRHGSIGTVDMKGSYKVFAQLESMPSTFGIRVDDVRNRVWVAVNDIGISEKSSPATQGKLAAVAVFDSKAGTRVGYYDLASVGPAARNANDIALDPDGNAYVTDSFAQLIYRIDAGGKLTVFADSPLFKTGEGFGLNGIVYHPDKYLLVSASNSGDIFRVNLGDPRNIDKVRLPERFVGIDGINLIDPTHLVAAVNVGESGAVVLASEDGWSTAKVIARMPSLSSFASAVAVVGHDAWVLNARLDNLVDPRAQKVDQFILQKIDTRLNEAGGH